MHSIGILGAGTWGIALARLLVRNQENVTVWSALPEEIKTLRTTHVHPNLPGVILPEELSFTESIQQACAGKDMIVIAVPSVFVRSTIRQAHPYLSEGQIIVNVAKGIEADSLLTMTQVIASELQNLPQIPLVTLSGPTHAEEVIRDIPTTIVSACSDLQTAKIVQEVFSNGCMRTYTNTDVEGVELCGALKNIIALASGISDGLGYGDNTRAALINRGMTEITRLGVAMGCREQTFCGLAGIGDLIVTATSRHSRNYTCGHWIGQGLSPEDAIHKVGMVVEGVNVLPAALQLKQRYSVDMPIVDAVDSIVRKGVDPRSVAQALMNRDPKSENDGDGNELTVRFEEAVIKNRRANTMKRVITYGTFDLLHYGHINLLRRAKALGDYLVVVLSTDEFNWEQKHKKCYFSYEKRKALLEAIRYVDLVIPEENWDQKRSDIHEYHIDTFVMGDDWKGKFDYLKEEGCDVVYLPRTPEISTTQIKCDLGDKK